MSSSSTKKPFCKVCFHAGKNSSHPLRNDAGQTLCTYLLSLKCRNCGKCGHTVKYCKEPQKNKQQQQMSTARVPAVQMAPPKQEKPKQKTHFEQLQKLIKEEEEKEQQHESEELEQRLKEIAHKTNFPEISEKKVAKKASDSILSGWSKIAGTPIKVYEPISEEQVQPSKKEEAQPQSAYSSDFSAYNGKSWADWD